VTTPDPGQDNFGQREARLQRAKDLREAGRIAEALADLAQLARDYPQFSRMHHERGHCHILRRDARAALAALHEALRLNPILPATWDMLEQLYRMLGDSVRADAAGHKLAALKALPTELVVANSLHADGDGAQAEPVIRDYLRKDPRNVGAIHLLARLRNEAGDLVGAETLLTSALRLAPDYHAARFDLAMLLLHAQRPRHARQEAEALLRHDPANRAWRKALGAACIALGDFEAVIDLYAALLAEPCESPAEVADFLLWRGNALKTVGRLDEAIADYRAALAAKSDFAVAWFSLANLKTWRASDADLAQMRHALAQVGLPEADRIYLDFALGKALEDRGEYAASWQHYAQGNARRRAIARHHPQGTEAGLQRLRATFTAPARTTPRKNGAEDQPPIFLVGLPRSGSTLIEQILASHSQVEGTQELTEIGHYARELGGADPASDVPLHPEALLRLSSAQAQMLGTRYLAETRIYRPLGRPRFVDKMPNNVWHIGLIDRILPHSVIIDVRREPMACCFSNLKQLFGTTNQEFAYGIEDMARHYCAYLAMMDHWHAVLPGRVLTLHYEDVVDDLDDAVRRILAHCGLAFDPASLRFHETRRSVRTPSSEQVRRPIARDGLTQWQNYAPWLDPLREALGPALTAYRPVNRI
jgi:tetratricopeptide (TPR) repeat protein